MQTRGTNIFTSSIDSLTGGCSQHMQSNSRKESKSVASANNAASATRKLILPQFIRADMMRRNAWRNGHGNVAPPCDLVYRCNDLH